MATEIPTEVVTSEGSVISDAPTASAVYSASSFTFSKAKEADENFDITGKTASAIGSIAAKAVEVDEKFQILEKTSDAAMATMKKVTYGVGVVAKLAAGK